MPKPSRPALMYGLAKRGFSQSYTYFTWRRTAWELAGTRSSRAPTSEEYFRPNLAEHARHSPRALCSTRIAPSLPFASSWPPRSSNYGIYGPAYELLENIPREGSGEYLDNEKYELKRWHLERADNLATSFSA